MTSTPRAQLPPRLLPVLYFGAAHVALALAFGAVALDPRGVSGFFYHSRMLGIVHLVTLGWITASILGSLYLVGPIALRVWIPATWLDYAAFAAVFHHLVVSSLTCPHISSVMGSRMIASFLRQDM